MIELETSDPLFLSVLGNRRLGYISLFVHVIFKIFYIDKQSSFCINVTFVIMSYKNVNMNDKLFILYH